MVAWFGARDRSKGRFASNLCIGYEHIKYDPGFYTHQLLCHLGVFARRHGNILKYSSWVIEAANKVWKALCVSHCRQVDGEDARISKQVLERMLRITNPHFRAESQKGIRVRGVYLCGKCGREKRPGHTSECLGVNIV